MLRLSLHSIRLCIALCAALVLAGVRPASADSLLTFTGDFRATFSDAYAYDGTDFTTLPGLFDGLEGGTFRAAFTVPTVVPPTNPTFNFASYSFPAAYGLTFTLYDKNGQIVSEGTGKTSSPGAYVDNNVPTFSNGTQDGYLDKVSLFGTPAQLSGLQTPMPLYGSPDMFVGNASFDFQNFTILPVIPTNINDLNLPPDAATYLSFPFRTFSTGAFWGSGDYLDQGAPFQYIDSFVTYNITGVTVTAVPEPGSVALFVGMALAGAGFLTRRRNRRE